MVLPIVPLAVGGAVAGFLAGRVFGQPEAPSVALAGGSGAPADSSHTGTSSDLWDNWGTASLNFADLTSPPGELQGVTGPYDSSGLPGGSGGGSGSNIPPPNPVSIPGGYGSITSVPTYPAGATRRIRASCLKSLWNLSGGVLVKGPSGCLTFTAYAGPTVTMRTASGTASFARILSGVHAGAYVHTSDAGITWLPLAG